MESLVNLLAVAVVVLNFFALGTSRIRTVIHVVALQGLLVGVMPLLAHEGSTWRAVLLAAVTVAMKTVVIPRLLLRIVRDLSVHREVESLVGLTRSLLIGAAGTALVLQFAKALPLASDHAGELLVPASLATVFTGFLMLTTRIKAVSQVLGYLLLENGIFVFGMLLLEGMPLLVEMGGLLDLFAGVFIMGIIIGQIDRAFEAKPAAAPAAEPAAREAEWTILN